MKNIYITLLTGLLASCNVLDQEPVNEIREGNFYKTGTDAEAGISAAYDNLQNSWYYIFALAGDLQSDATQMRHAEDDAPFQIDEHRIQVDNYRVREFWVQMYRGINQINDLCERVPGISDRTFAKDKDRVLGEAYFLRALHYFYLVRTFGEVPLITKVPRVTDEYYTVYRHSKEEVYQQIIADLLEAEKKLPVKYTTNLETRGRATVGAARALLAKVYLTRKAAGDFELAASKAAAVIADAGTYELVAKEDYPNLFNVDYKNEYRESVFEVQYDYENTNNLAGDYNNAWKIGVSPQLAEAFATEWEGVRRQAILGEYEGEYYVDKYKSNENNVILIRLPDVMLMQAEALNELGQSDQAIALVNQIRARVEAEPSTAVTPEEIRLAIEQERLLELAFEGHRWFDLVRTGRAKEVLNIDDQQLLWPIPGEEIRRNPKLIQNPGYTQ